ncbi:hypothetical protein [Dipodfec virus UOA04_Rod_462]|nr:hypothetical protein [Dipodfec virus UOA04_Rod_462]
MPYGFGWTIIFSYICIVIINLFFQYFMELKSSKLIEIAQKIYSDVLVAQCSALDYLSEANETLRKDPEAAREAVEFYGSLVVLASSVYKNYIGDGSK